MHIGKSDKRKTPTEYFTPTRKDMSLKTPTTYTKSVFFELLEKFVNR